MTDAAARAALQMRGSEPSRSARVSTARAMNAAGAWNVSLGAAFQAISSEVMRPRTGAAPPSATRLTMARTGRDVGFGPLCVAADAERIVGGTARQ